MNRLEKKCLLGSAATHGLLAVSFLFGSAFLGPRPSHDQPRILEVVPANALKVTDGRSSGGDPSIPPPPAARAPEIKPPAPRPVEKPPEPVKPQEVPPPKAAPPKERSDLPGIKETVNKRKLPTNLVSRATIDTARVRAERLAREKAEAQARADAQAEAAYRSRMAGAASAIGKALSGLGSSLSGSTVTVQGSFGPGGGGPAVANWRAAVGDLYTRAWQPPQDAAGSAKVQARVTIARDGSVLSARRTVSSGDTALDSSVDQVLREVRAVPAFPAEAREENRILTIIFDLTVKRSLG